MDFVVGGFLIALFGVPLVIGGNVMAAGYRRGSFVWKTLGLLIGPVLFFLTCYVVFMTAAGMATEAGRRICGAMGAVALVLTVAGSVLELAASLVVMEVIASRTRRRTA
jgi:hypothetical protein